jgi:hypothetical protein
MHFETVRHQPRRLAKKEMNMKKRTPKGIAHDPASIPGFARAIRGLAHVPKAEVDEAMARERQAKKHRRQPK